MVFGGSSLVTKDIVAGVDEDILKSVQSVSPAAMPSPIFALVFLSQSVDSLGLDGGIKQEMHGLPEFIGLLERKTHYDLLR